MTPALTEGLWFRFCRLSLTPELLTPLGVATNYACSNEYWQNAEAKPWRNPIIPENELKNISCDVSFTEDPRIMTFNFSIDDKEGKLFESGKNFLPSAKISNDYIIAPLFIGNGAIQISRTRGTLIGQIAAMPVHGNCQISIKKF